MVHPLNKNLLLDQLPNPNGNFYVICCRHFKFWISWCWWFEPPLLFFVLSRDCH